MMYITERATVMTNNMERATLMANLMELATVMANTTALKREQNAVQAYLYILNGLNKTRKNIKGNRKQMP